MNYFVIQYKAGQRGCPVILSGEISHDWEWEPMDPDPDKFEIIHSYEYYWKAQVIDFDYWNDTMIGSSGFSGLCEEFGARFRKVPLKIIQSNKRETVKDYDYLLWKDWLSILDVEKSEYEVDRVEDSGQLRFSRFFPSIIPYEIITHFVVDKNKVNGNHVFKCIELDDDVVCDELFRDACHQKNLIGIEFVPIEEFKKIPFWRK